jgi:transporter family protein
MDLPGPFRIRNRIVLAVLFPRSATGPVSKVAPIDKLSIGFVVVTAAFFLGERISLGTGIGVIMLVTGAIMLAST